MFATAVLTRTLRKMRKPSGGTVGTAGVGDGVFTGPACLSVRRREPTGTYNRSPTVATVARHGEYQRASVRLAVLDLEQHNVTCVLAACSSGDCTSSR